MAGLNCCRGRAPRRGCRCRCDLSRPFLSSDKMMFVEIEFDPVKDHANLAKHGISLGRVRDLEILAFVDDRDRFDEPRYRLYGLIDGRFHCVAAIDRGSTVRVISVRRAHEKEYRRYVR